jgi:GT2 family glycosyltransferase
MNVTTYFVTLNWNTTDLLRQMVDSVEATTPEPHRWLIVDNGSDRENEAGLYDWATGFLDDPLIVSADWCNNHGQTPLRSRDVIVRSDVNLGCVKGHNLAFDIVGVLSDGGPHEIVMVDTDVVVSERGWLSKVHAWADEHPQVGIVGLEHGPNVVCAPAIFLDTNGNWYLHERQMQRAQPAEGESVGLGFAVLRWPVLEAGLRFDTDFVMYYKQDDDLCFQVRAGLGLEVWVFPVGNVHAGSGSLRANHYQCGDADGWDEFDQVKQRNQQYFTQKWRWALAGRRRNMEGEARHLAAMKGQMAERGQGDES